MSLTVETGSGGDALISLADFKTYCSDIGYDLTAFTQDAVIEQAIRRGSSYISNAFRFKGIRVGGRNQIQAWPRSDVQTDEGWPVDYQSIPREVKSAAAEASFYELENPNALAPSVTLTDRVTQEQVGPLSVTYAPATNDAAASRPILTIVMDMLAPLLDRSSGISGVTARANRG